MCAPLLVDPLVVPGVGGRLLEVLDELDEVLDPGRVIRVVGEVTAERLRILREADSIVQEEMERFEFYRDIWQSFAVLLPIQSVGVMGDKRTYEYAITLRVVESTDGMTANWVYLPRDILSSISNRISNEVAGVNRVVLDVTSKPPSTIEWE